MPSATPIIDLSYLSIHKLHQAHNESVDTLGLVRVVNFVPISIALLSPNHLQRLAVIP